MKKRIFISMLILILSLSLCSCEKVNKYKNEVEYTEFMSSFKELIHHSIITKDLDFDFAYTLKGHEKYDDEEIKTESYIKHDQELGFTKWETFEKEKDTLMYIKEDERSIIFYEVSENNNIKSSEASIVFEKYVKINVLNSFNYNFIPVEYTCYHDNKKDKDVFTIIYKNEKYTKTIQYLISDTIVSKTIIEKYKENSNGLKYKYLSYEFKINEVDLIKEHTELGIGNYYG